MYGKHCRYKATLLFIYLYFFLISFRSLKEKRHLANTKLQRYTRARVRRPYKNAHCSLCARVFVSVVPYVQKSFPTSIIHYLYYSVGPIIIIVSFTTLFDCRFDNPIVTDCSARLLYGAPFRGSRPQRNTPKRNADGHNKRQDVPGDSFIVLYFFFF